MAGLVPPAWPTPLRRGEGPAINILLMRGHEDKKTAGMIFGEAIQ